MKIYMADSSLLPVVVGGLLTMGGGIIGFIGSTIRDLMQERINHKRRRAEKFEELVEAIYEFDHWLDLQRRKAFGDSSAEITFSPFARIQAITSVYFPQFDALVRHLDEKTSEYRIWIENTNIRRLTIPDANLVEGFVEAVRPYSLARDKLVEQISKFAQTNFREAGAKSLLPWKRS